VALALILLLSTVKAKVLTKACSGRSYLRSSQTIAQSVVTVGRVAKRRPPTASSFLLMART